jgi:hypothetical protein
MRFSPSSEFLCVTTCYNDILLFAVADRALSDWSTATLGRIPSWLKYRLEIISGITFANEKRMFVHGVSFSCLIDLNTAEEGVKEDAKDVKRDADGVQKKHRKEASGFTKIERFSPLMMMDFVGDEEMVVVERPMLKIMENLPEGYSKKAFGN